VMGELFATSVMSKYGGVASDQDQTGKGMPELTIYMYDKQFCGWVRIRIRIMLFSSVTTNKFFSPKFFAYYFLKLHLHHFFKDKKSQRSHKTVGIKFFLAIFA
jgi:hypothetical protein